jgi:hypothetical protein
MNQLDSYGNSPSRYGAAPPRNVVVEDDFEYNQPNGGSRYGRVPVAASIEEPNLRYGKAPTRNIQRSRSMEDIAAIVNVNTYGEAPPNNEVVQEILIV